MERIDVRRMSVDEQAVVRKIIIRMKQNGSAIAEIINAIGCSAQHIAHTWRKYNNASGKAAKEKIVCVDKRGREKGEGRTIDFHTGKENTKTYCGQISRPVEF
jgi:hypothetical protein